MMDRFKEFNQQGIQEIQKQVRLALPGDDCSPLPWDFQPRIDDVICGKGNSAWNHPGNIRFRLLLETNLVRYVKASSKYKKSLLVSEIVSAVHQGNVVFVKLDSTAQWHQVGHDAAREKTGQAIRDLLQKQKKHPTHILREARKEQNRLKDDDEQRAVYCKSELPRSAENDISRVRCSDNLCKSNSSNWDSSDSSTNNGITYELEDEEEYSYEPLPFDGSLAQHMHSPEWLEAFSPPLQFILFDERMADSTDLH